MKIGTLELLVILIVALFALGPEKMPVYAKKLGKTLSLLKSYTGKLAEDINDNITEPLEEVKKPLKDATEPLTNITKDITDPIRDIKNTVSQIGKPVKSDKTSDGNIVEDESPDAFNEEANKSDKSVEDESQTKSI